MIGVFDSGSGGLTVLSALADRLPERRLVYLGDHAHAPYGGRVPDDILTLTRNGVDRLFGLGCRLVVVACNTAAAVALRPLQQDWLPRTWPERRMLGVFVPMVEAITGQPWHGETVPATSRRTIGVFATPRTALTAAWVREVRSRAPDVTMVQQQCPGLVAMIEGGAPRTQISSAVGAYVDGLMGRVDGPLDAVVLGCTHFPLIADLFRAHLPAGTEILDQPREVAESLVRYLERHPEFAPRPDETPGLRFLTTGARRGADRVASAWFGRPVKFEPVPPAAMPRAG